MNLRKLSFTLLTLALIIRTAMLPRSIGYAYGPAHFYNLYLPNFGVASDISILPSAFKTLMTSYALLKIALDIFGDNPLITYQIFYIVQPLLTFFGLVLFFSILPEFREYRLPLSAILAIIINWPAESYLAGALILGMTSLFWFIKDTRFNIKSMILGYMSFITLSLYWHSAHILFATVIISNLIFTMVYQQNSNAKDKRAVTILLLIIISTTIWLYIRKYQSQVVSNLLDFTYYLNPHTIYRGLFFKGAFLPPAYLYEFDFPIIGTLADYTRFITYFIAFSVNVFIAVHTLISKRHNLERTLSVSLPIGASTFIFLYYIATETFGPTPLIVFILPYVLAVCVLKLQNHDSRRKIWIILILYIFISLTFSGTYYEYMDKKTNPKFQEDFNDYSIYPKWIVSHFNETCITSDAATIGYTAIWYGKGKLYQKTKIHYNSIGNNEYHQIYIGEYPHSCIIMYNFELYKKNLIFNSLQAWNKYKPLPPNVVQKNTLNILYNNDKVWILG